MTAVTPSVPDADATEDRAAETIVRTMAELRATLPPEIEWLVPGMLAPGMATELNAREKVGKGTLIFYLIAALERGEPTVFGPATDGPVKTLIYSEEPDAALGEKGDKFDVRQAGLVAHRQLRTMTWAEKRDWLVGAAVRGGYGVLFLDNISAATGIVDEAGVELARAVEPLIDLAREAGIALLYDRHQRKADGAVEDLSRGGTALAGAVDVIVTMTKTPKSDWETRDRRLRSRGRVSAALWDKTITLTDDGGDYTLAVRGSGDDPHTRIARALGAGHVWTKDAFMAATGLKDTRARDWLDEHGAVVKRLTQPGPHNKIQWEVLPFDSAPPALN